MAKIYGNTVTTPMAVPDWNQTDENRADYIKNKPTILTEEDVVELIGENGGGASVSDEKIAEAVGRYFVDNPIVETDPTVPNWAMQPNKPTYTADEVGAYGKKYVDEVAATKADKADTYTKQEVLNMHSNLVHNDTYERDMNKKADKATTYTKTEVVNLINSAIGEALEGDY